MKTFTDEEIYTKVMDYPNGCHDGKMDFLNHLGINLKKKARVTVEFDLDQYADPEVWEDLGWKCFFDNTGTYTFVNHANSYKFISCEVEGVPCD
jgi:hypothetical protein